MYIYIYIYIHIHTYAHIHTHVNHKDDNHDTHIASSCMCASVAVPPCVHAPTRPHVRASVWARTRSCLPVFHNMISYNLI